MISHFDAFFKNKNQGLCFFQIFIKSVYYLVFYLKKNHIIIAKKSPTLDDIYYFLGDLKKARKWCEFWSIFREGGGCLIITQQF